MSDDAPVPQLSKLSLGREPGEGRGPWLCLVSEESQTAPLYLGNCLQSLSQGSREENQKVQGLWAVEGGLSSILVRQGAAGTEKARIQGQPLTSLLPLTAPEGLSEGRTRLTSTLQILRVQ